MTKQITKIIKQYGMEVLQDLDLLSDILREERVSDKDIYTLMLVLKCCPTIIATLNRGEVTSVEANSLLRTASMKTGLTLDSLRRVLAPLFHACDVETHWDLHLTTRDWRAVQEVLPWHTSENAVTELVERLAKSDENSAVFSDLEQMAHQGNTYAAYALGTYYKKLDDKDGGETGKPYFEKAYAMGYGPAAGALASYKMRQKRKSLGRIASYFQNPTVLSGEDGREWAPLSQKILAYRQNNVGRCRSLLPVQVIALILTLLLQIFMAGGFWGGLAVALQAGGLVWNLLCRFWKPYYSVRNVCYCLMLSWAILIMAIL